MARILMVDDSKTSRKILRSILKRMGMRLLVKP